MSEKNAGASPLIKRKDVEIKSEIPKLEIPKLVTSTDYKIELVFNEKAELIAINSSKEMYRGNTIEHLAIGILYLGGLINKEE
jgi:hypothetical protein